jgi:hypothetical protein
MLTPAQYRSDAPGSLTSVLRRYTSTDLRLYYSANRQDYGDNTPALAAPPTIARVDATADPAAGTVTFVVRVVGDPSAGIQEAWVTYAGVTPGAWESLDLTQGVADSTIWTGTLTGLTPAQIAAFEFVVQATNGVGLVGYDDNQGLYYRPGQIPPAFDAQSPTPRTATTLQLQSPPAGGAYGSAPTLRAALTDASGPVAGEPVTFTIGGSVRTATTDAGGVATVTLPLVDLPGDYTLSAAFDGDALLTGSSAASAFAVTRLGTALALTVPGGTVNPESVTGVVATLTSGGVPLAQKAVAFVLTAPSRPQVVVTRTTDLFGRAVLGTVTLPDGSSLAVASYTVKAYFGPPAPLALPADPVYASSSSANGTLGVVWPFTGFLIPLVNPPNMASWPAGTLLPVSWTLGGYRGLNVLASAPTSAPINCTTKATTGAAQATTGVLVFIPILNVYTYAWNDPKSWANTCRVLSVKLADGTTRTAYVRFTR